MKEKLLRLIIITSALALLWPALPVSLQTTGRDWAGDRLLWLDSQILTPEEAIGSRIEQIGNDN